MASLIAKWPWGQRCNLWSMSLTLLRLKLQLCWIQGLKYSSDSRPTLGISVTLSSDPDSFSWRKTQNSLLFCYRSSLLLWPFQLRNDDCFPEWIRAALVLQVRTCANLLCEPVVGLHLYLRPQSHACWLFCWWWRNQSGLAIAADSQKRTVHILYTCNIQLPKTKYEKH